MAVVNHSKKEINAKIVYYGPADCGKGTALKYIFSRIKPSLRGELKNVPAGADNLMFFDFSPFDGPTRNGYRVRLHVYTLTGRVTNPATWKMTLKGTDGLIVMLDSSSDRISDNQEKISQLRDFLSAYGIGLQDTPAVLQLNGFESGLPAMNSEQLVSSIDLDGLPCFYSNANRGEGLLEALTALFKMVLDRITENGDEDRGSSEAADLEDLPELTGNHSIEGSENSSETDAIQADEIILSPVSLSHEGVSVQGTTLRIPLDITCGGTNRRLIVTVSVDPE